MPKKTTKLDLSATIQFRPGRQLGELIDEFARAWEVSRGEAAKRLVVLASHGLDLDCCQYAEELSGYLHGADLEEACRYIQVYLLDIEKGRQAKGQPPLGRDEKLEQIKILVAQHRSLREIEQQAERQQVHVRIYLTE